jgi:hypothetical protein
MFDKYFSLSLPMYFEYVYDSFVLIFFHYCFNGKSASPASTLPNFCVVDPVGINWRTLTNLSKFLLLWYDQVIIITNSDDGWVKYSCERIVPSLLPALEKYKIVSARTKYEKFYPGQPLCWKAAAFAHEANEIFQSFECAMEGKASRCPSLELSDVSSEDSFDASPEKGTRPREIISFGDSMEERTAVRIVAEQLDATAKSVMFVSCPTPSQIIGQLYMLTDHMKFVCEHSLALDLEICPNEAKRYAESYTTRRKTKLCSLTVECPAKDSEI